MSTPADFERYSRVPGGLILDVQRQELENHRRRSLLSLIPETHLGACASYQLLCCAGSPLFALYRDDQTWWHEFSRSYLEHMKSPDFHEFTGVTYLYATPNFQRFNFLAGFLWNDLNTKALLYLEYAENGKGDKVTEDEYPVRLLHPTTMMIQAARAMFSRDFIMISIDLEFYEQNTDIITEIGISVLRSRDSSRHCAKCGSSSGPLNMVPDIETYHIVTAEHSTSTRNGKYVPDHRGLSTNAVSVKLFKKHRLEYLNQIISDCQNDAYGWGEVPIYYVGHSVRSDLDALLRDGYSLPAYPVLDSATIWTYPLTRESISLQNIALELGLQQRFLHNAANDALLALHAVMRMCDPAFRRQNSMPQLIDIVRLAPQIMERQAEMKKECASLGIQMMSYQPPVSKKDSARRGRPDVYESHEYMKKPMSRHRDIPVVPYFVGMLDDTFIQNAR